MSKGLGRLFWFNWVTSKVLHMLKKIHWHSTLLILRCFNGTWKSNVFLHCTSVVIVVTSKNTLYLSGIVQLKLINKLKKKKKNQVRETFYCMKSPGEVPFSFFIFLVFVFVFVFFIFFQKIVPSCQVFIFPYLLCN